MHNKFQNVGQFCVSPDHVYLDRRIDVARFEQLVKEAAIKYVGIDPQASPHFSRVINVAHQRRLVRYRDPADHGGRNLLEVLLTLGLIMIPSPRLLPIGGSCAMFLVFCMENALSPAEPFLSSLLTLCMLIYMPTLFLSQRECSRPDRYSRLGLDFGLLSRRHLLEMINFIQYALFVARRCSRTFIPCGYCDLCAVLFFSRCPTRLTSTSRQPWC